MVCPTVVRSAVGTSDWPFAWVRSPWTLPLPSILLLHTCLPSRLCQGKGVVYTRSLTPDSTGASDTKYMTPESSPLKFGLAGKSCPKWTRPTDPVVTRGWDRRVVRSVKKRRKRSFSFIQNLSFIYKMTRKEPHWIMHHCRVSDFNWSTCQKSSNETRGP